MQVTFLGTNGWYSTNLGNTVCTLIELDDAYIVLDAGDGFYKLDQHIQSEKPIYIFLSHLHLDHIGGFHILAKFTFKQKISVYGFEGTQDFLNKLVRHPYTMDLKELPYKVEINDIKEGTFNNPVNFSCKLLNHPDPCVGYRFTLNNSIIVYCTDTGLCDNLFDLAKNADILICECSLKSGQVEPDWGHLNPEDAAKVAKQSNVKQLIFTHFTASIFTNMGERNEAENTARKIFKKTKAAYDGFTIKI